MAAGADDGEGDLAGQQFVIGEALGGFVVRNFFWGVQGAQGLLETGPATAVQNAGVVPFGESGQAFQRAQSGAAHNARDNARRERPDRFDPREIIRL